MRGNDRLFVGQSHPVFSFLEGLYEGERTEEVSGQTGLTATKLRTTSPMYIGMLPVCLFVCLSHVTL